MSVVKQIRWFITKNAPMILTVSGIGGVISTAILAAKAAAEGADIIRRREVCEDRSLTVKEKTALTWDLYVPAVAMGVATIGTIVAAHSVSTKRHAAVLSLYTATEATLHKYRDKLVEAVGKNEERKIHDKVTQDIISKNPASKTEIFITGRGDTQCYDSMSGRYFTSNVETIRRVENDINKEVIHQNYVQLNTLYSLLGLKTNTMGDLVGWNTDRMLEINLDAMVSEDNIPCLVLDYRVLSEFDNLH